MNVSDVMSTDVKFIGNQESVTKALSLMEREQIRQLPVVSGDKVNGLITLHSIITQAHYSSDTKVSKLMFKPPLLNPGDDVYTALKLMRDTGVRGLPVVRAGSLIGFVSDFDLLKVLRAEVVGSVNDFMRESASNLLLTDSIAKVKRLMHYEKVNSLPVINNSNKLIGVLREEDLGDLYKPHESMGHGTEGAGDSNTFLNADVKSILGDQFFYLMVGSPIRKAIDLMLKHDLASLIIVDDAEEPIGYLDRFELIKFLYNERKPRGVFLKFSGLKLDYPTNTLLTKVVSDHLNRVNYLAKNIQQIIVQIKGLHAGKGVRKFELDLKIKLLTGVTQRVSKVGYALRECLDEALSDVEKIMKKDYKKANP